MVGVLTTAKLAMGLAVAHNAIGAVADTITSNVNLGNLTGVSQRLASGTLYGLPNNEDQIPSHFFTDIGWNYERAGGAQLPAPARGWIWGVNEYKNRFTSVLHNYVTTRKEGGKFIFLIHDLYGADGTQNSSTVYPGDNGDWSYWDSYLTHVFSDMKSNQMIDDVIVDIWNEPDLGTVFWGRSQDQYLQMWGRTYAAFREQFGTSVLLSGPASAGEPLANYEWWTNWAAFVAQNNSVPDQYAWHMEAGVGDLLSAYDGLVTILGEYDLPARPVNINEYATYPEQVPSGIAWWISQLERMDFHGLRGNWLSGFALHDFMASLLGKPHAGLSTYKPKGNNYWGNGDWQVYKYYNMNMTGQRIGTMPSEDLKIDTYATNGTDGVVRVLTGVRITTGTWTVALNNLSALGLPTEGSLNIHTWGFPAAPNVHYGEVDGPNDLGYYSHAYSGDSVAFPVFQTDTTTAYAFTFALDQSRTTF